MFMILNMQLHIQILLQNRYLKSYNVTNLRVRKYKGMEKKRLIHEKKTLSPLNFLEVGHGFGSVF